MAKHTHELVAQTAKEMAGAVYDEMMSQNNDLYAAAKREGLTRGRFIQKYWPAWLSQAKSTLVDLLSTPISDTLKEQISDAIISDHNLVRGKRHLLPR